MKAFVIGLGSMGCRRVRLLKELAGIRIIGMDKNKERREEAARKLEIEVCTDMEEVGEGVLNDDCAFICTSPLSHEKVIRGCLQKNLNVFTEINLTDGGYAENIRLARERKRVLFLSSTFLYRPETEYIIGRVRQSRRPVSYMYHVGQYLPDWHPWESYQNFFAGDARTNGCREIFAIELPWLVTCFGAIKTLSAVGRKNTSLQVKYRDTYQVQICHENGAMGMLAVDVVSRRPVRKFEVYSEDLYLTWDGTPDSIQEYDIQKKSGRPVEMKSGEHREGSAAFITEDAYRKEIDAFLSAVHNRQKDFRWDFERDQAILHVIDEIEGQNEKAKTE